MNPIQLHSPLPHIKQRDTSDCGIACVAMLAGASYEGARSAVYSYWKFLPNLKPRTKDLVRGLRVLGVLTGPRLHVLGTHELAPRHSTICRINHKTGNGWHWIVCCRLRSGEIWWHDPQTEGGTLDIYERPTSYIPILGGVVWRE